MTQASSNPIQTGGARRAGVPAAPAAKMVAVLHDLGPRGIAVTVGQVSAEGDAAARDARRITARTFSPAELPSLRAFLRESDVELVIRIVPAAQAICRLAPLPESAASGSRESLADALSLMSEAELPAQLPWYRRAAGLVSIAGAPTALLIGWHDRSGADSGSDRFAESLSGLPQIWTVEAVALASLLPQVTPSRAAWVLAAHPAAGAVSILAAGTPSNGPDAARSPVTSRIRSLRADAGGSTSWRESLSQALAETVEGLSSGELDRSPIARIHSDAFSLVRSDATPAVVAGEGRDAAWLNQFGIAAATLAVFSDPDPSVRALFNLHAVEPRERANPIRRLVDWLSTPLRAAAVIILCGATLLGARLGVAYARDKALTEQVGDTSGLQDRLDSSERWLAFYSTLKERRWPITKLMADIAGAAPVGVELELLEITQGETITIRGTAEGNQLVSQFRENLGKTRVFENITTPNIGTSAGAVQFQLQARPTADGVLYVSPPVDDFAARPLGVRMYGDDWVLDTDAARSAPRSSAPSPRASGSSSSSDRSNRSSTPAPSASADKAAANALPPLSEEQIAAMDRVTAMKEFGIRRKAASLATDRSIKERLNAEAERCKQRMLEAGRAESGGGA